MLWLFIIMYNAGMIIIIYLLIFIVIINILLIRICETNLGYSLLFLAYNIMITITFITNIIFILLTML